MPSIRDYSIFYPRKRVDGAAGTTTGGGGVVLSTPQHDIDGAEHTDFSGDTADVLRGDRTQSPVTFEELQTVETDVTKRARPDGAGGVEWADAGVGIFHPVMAQDPSGAEPARWWVVVDGSGTAVMAEV